MLPVGIYFRGVSMQVCLYDVYVIAEVYVFGC